MMKIIYTTYLYLGDKKQHLISAYDDNDNIIDMLEIIERHGHVTSCKSIIE